MLNASFLKAGESKCSPTPSYCQPPILQSWGCLWGKTGLLGLAQQVLQAGAITRLVAPEQGAEHDLRAPCVCQEEVTGLLLQDLRTGISIGLAEALAQCCLGGETPRDSPLTSCSTTLLENLEMGTFMFTSLSRKMFSRFKPLQRRGSTCCGQAGADGRWGRKGQEPRKDWVDEGPGRGGELGLASSGEEGE